MKVAINGQKGTPHIVRALIQEVGAMAPWHITEAVSMDLF